MRETPRIAQMFEYYYALGEDRTLQKVSDRFDVSRQSITKYAREFKWSDRVYERDTQIMKELRDQNNDDIKETMDSYRKVIKASVADYISRLKSKKVRVESVRDFVKLVELEMKICGFESQLFEEKIEQQNIKLSSEATDTINKLLNAIDEKGDDSE